MPVWINRSKLVNTVKCKRTQSCTCCPTGKVLIPQTEDHLTQGQLSNISPYPSLGYRSPQAVRLNCHVLHHNKTKFHETQTSLVKTLQRAAGVSSRTGGVLYRVDSCLSGWSPPWERSNVVELVSKRVRMEKKARRSRHREGPSNSCFIDNQKMLLMDELWPNIMVTSTYAEINPLKVWGFTHQHHFHMDVQ